MSKGPAAGLVAKRPHLVSVTVRLSSSARSTSLQPRCPLSPSNRAVSPSRMIVRPSPIVTRISFALMRGVGRTLLGPPAGSFRRSFFATQRLSLPLSLTVLLSCVPLDGRTRKRHPGRQEFVCLLQETASSCVCESDHRAYRSRHGSVWTIEVEHLKTARRGAADKYCRHQIGTLQKSRPA